VGFPAQPATRKAIVTVCALFLSGGEKPTDGIDHLVGVPGYLSSRETSKLPAHFEQQILAPQIRLETVSGGMSLQSVDFDAFQGSRPGKVEHGDGAIGQVNNVLARWFFQAGCSHSSEKHRLGRATGRWPGPPGVKDPEHLARAFHTPASLDGNKVGHQRGRSQAPTNGAFVNQLDGRRWVRPGDVKCGPLRRGDGDRIDHNRLDLSPRSVNDDASGFRALSVGDRDFDRSRLDPVESMQDDRRSM
jgi:hypothetical protein